MEMVVSNKCAAATMQTLQLAYVLVNEESVSPLVHSLSDH